MQDIQELMEDEAILMFKKQYLSYSPGTRVVATREIIERDREENVIVFRIKGTFSTNTIRREIFWDYLEML